MRKIAARAALLVTGVMASQASLAVDGYNSRYNMTEQVTSVGAQIYDLHNLMLIICTAIFVGVFGVMFYSIYAHRKSKGHKAAQFHENTTVEILWTVIPVAILVGMAYPATKTIIDMKDTSNPDLTIKATGYQWKWGYDYVNGEGQGIQFISTLATPRAQIDRGEWKGENYLLEVDNPVVVPAGKKVRVLLTAADVVHAWWIPAFGVKQDAFPGLIRETWFRTDKEGVYRGSCVELCGKDHAFMPIEVHVVSPQAYTAWVASQKSRMAAGVTNQVPAVPVSNVPAPADPATAPGVPTAPTTPTAPQSAPVAN